MIKQLLVSSCVLFSATFVVQAQNPKLGVSPIQDVINAMTLDEKIQLVVGSSGKYESQMEATIGNQGQLVQGAAGHHHAGRGAGRKPVCKIDQHRQQDIGNDKVDGDKRQIQQEPHLKRLGQFGNGKRGHEDQHVVFGNLIMLFFGPDTLRRAHEGPEHAVLRIVRKEPRHSFGYA